MVKLSLKKLTGKYRDPCKTRSPTGAKKKGARDIISEWEGASAIPGSDQRHRMILAINA